MCCAKGNISTYKDGKHSEKPYEKYMFPNIGLVTRTAENTSIRRKEHRDLASDNRVPPLLDRTPQKHQETEGKKSRTGSTFKTEVETTKGAVVNMESTYYNLSAPVSYVGFSKSKPKGYMTKEVREWLQSQDTYTLHKPTRRRFTRRRVVVYGINHQWQADLVDLTTLSSYNKGFKYLLTCIDVLSRYAWVVPLQDKAWKTLNDAF
jgi:hypothetical protein